MYLVSSLVRYDTVLEYYTVDFVEDFENEVAIFQSASKAEDFVKQLQQQGYKAL